MNGGSTARGRAGGAPEATVLLDAFDALHAEVIRQKRRIVGAKPGAGPAPEAVKQRLLDFIEKQAADARRELAEHELRAYEDAQYVMVAMADEVFLHLDWPGREAWMARPLEAHVFRTHDAGERFFRKLDEILDGGAPTSPELVTVYLTALALGFRGKFRSVGLPTEPESYRRRLSRHLYRIDPESGVPARQLCPEAHSHTLEAGNRTYLPGLKNGFLPLLVVFACLVVVAQIIWSVRTSDVADALDRIEEAQ